MIAKAAMNNLDAHSNKSRRSGSPIFLFHSKILRTCSQTATILEVWLKAATLVPRSQENQENQENQESLGSRGGPEDRGNPNQQFRNLSAATTREILRNQKMRQEEVFQTYFSECTFVNKDAFLSGREQLWRR